MARLKSFFWSLVRSVPDPASTANLILRSGVETSTMSSSVSILVDSSKLTLVAKAVPRTVATAVGVTISYEWLESTNLTTRDQVRPRDWKMDILRLEA
ncbi:MAG: hypothetical protein UX80_C0003G0071 [Candidatus Amesbacteria bacterium GW2011_GWA2_47_11b]|uniref:Uncharacterized protein n=1 Tax=Candidatus Amesbacteria bacterium GW2011_GWA2_47_11b TaxID=1618358 RepID=A0A0G1RMP1_9BACT|nr:MAG: hypothetical protein UX80_C0003G0071 [Candidatus Amesbacteria bacterium GW2011_GWA2_47_11b]